MLNDTIYGIILAIPGIGMLDLAYRHSPERSRFTRFSMAVFGCCGIILGLLVALPGDFRSAAIVLVVVGVSAGLVTFYTMIREWMG